MMGFAFRLVDLSLTLKIAWAVWLVAAFALTVWRRRGRTQMAARPVVTRARKTETDAAQSEKRRWRLRANAETPVLQQTSMLGL